ADRAGGVDLLAALVADPLTRAAEVLARAAVEPHTVLARVESHFAPAPEHP
ncbi:peptidase, partial [Streptomyces sp. NPDC005549]